MYDGPLHKLSNICTTKKHRGESEELKKQQEEYETEASKLISRYAYDNEFYSLPSDMIMNIIRKSHIENLEVLCSTIFKINVYKEEDAYLLIKEIDREDASFDDCIKIISSFRSIPICRRLRKLYDEKRKLPELDYPKEIEELNTQIKSLNAEKEKIEEGFVEVVKYFNKTCRANVEIKDEKGFTLLNKAALNGQLEVVKCLYETCHAKVETKDENERTSINNAALKGHIEVVKYLYETCHANVEAKDENGFTPINSASNNGHLEVVKYLCETCHANIKTKDFFGNTPMKNALINRYSDVYKYLEKQNKK